jgi:hypothetical protein
MFVIYSRTINGSRKWSAIYCTTDSTKCANYLQYKTDEQKDIIEYYMKWVKEFTHGNN